jgi:hypothetical protein
MRRDKVHLGRDPVRIELRRGLGDLGGLHPVPGESLGDELASGLGCQRGIAGGVGTM